MAAQHVPHPSTDKKRVKVYELRNNDWFDRGTGFCSASFNPNEDGDRRDPQVVVESEDQPDRILLETRISKEDGFHKQQETLIVWTEPTNGIDMALSFQEAEGCSMIWKFVHTITNQYNPNNGQDDSELDDLAIDMPNPISLPEATMGNLTEIEAQMRMLSGSPHGRDALTKHVLAEDLIGKLIPLVSDAEDLESLSDLHRLCNIMKVIILLNDTSIIEHAVSDECVIGVVGALEYDPDFPSHKANHRQWLQGEGRYREVVRIEDGQIIRKIHQTYRLGYLKDVVLARILDDNTFSVLNSLIFFNQVDIVQHLQANSSFLGELFNIFKSDQDPTRKKEAVLFIEQCCSIAKNLQPPSRQTLYNNFIAHGLLQVINFGLKHTDVAVRVGATNILVSIIEHDPHVIRQTMYRQIHEKQSPLTDTLIDLLLVETDLGVKSHISDALKVLLDQGPTVQSAEAFAKANGEYAARAGARLPQGIDPQQEQFLELFYSKPALKLFQPLIALKDRSNVEFSNIEASAFSYLVEILCFFIRQHGHRSKYFVLNNDIVLRIVQLLQSPEKFLKLISIRFLRQLAGTMDEFYVKHLAEKKVMEPVLDLLIKTMPRDNLLSSACLELFEHIKKECVRELIKHMVENYREKLQRLSYMEVFRTLLLRYDQTAGFTVNLEYFMESEDEAGRRRQNINPRTGPMEHLTMDQAEEEYFNTSDDEDDLPTNSNENGPRPNGESTGHKLMVDYASDEELDENVEAGTVSAEGGKTEGKMSKDNEAAASILPSSGPPPERVSEKRRREEDEEDDLSKMIQHKRRNSTSAGANAASAASNVMRKKKITPAAKDMTVGSKKIAISLSSSGRTGSQSGDD
ncbi:DUF625-domain-containing protein [Xylariaceae sp. FL0255]|nr:DUF625-domain-containing protein [Xylariaceae sp. FL0255]